jgi:hypothetical protein
MDPLLKDTCRLLHESNEGLGFNKILARLRQERKDQRRKLVSSGTLAEALKRLQEAGYVARDLRTRKYKLTELGEMSSGDPLITFRKKTRRELEIGQPDPLDFMTKAYVRGLETSGKEQVVLPDSIVQQITDQVKQFANGKTLAINKLWTDITDNFLIELSSFLPAFMVMHTSYAAASVPRENTTILIDKAVALWSKFRLDRLHYTLSSYLSHPEVLAAIDKAIRRKAFKDNLASTPFEQICNSLRRQKYL